MKYSVITFGCRVNQADSTGFEEELLAMGAACAPVEEADFILVNTCSVTATADQGARQTIRRIARQNPAAQVVVTGCYATRSPEDVGQLPNVVKVIANEDKPRLISIVRSAGLGRDARGQSDLASASSDSHQTSAERFGNGDGSCGATIEPGFAGRTAFTLRVQTGCGESCSYCIIPATRGRPRSVAVDHVLREVRRVAGAGFKEIALTGVHLGSYGRDLVPASTLDELLRALADDPATGDVLFRISSLEPMDCTPAIVALVAEGGRFAPHFHLPLQHASDRVLTLMRRPYTFRYYQALVAGIRRDVPDASIGSDIIVGFPGETDQDFAELTAYLETSPLTHIHVFPYSDRPGTAASGMTGKVPGPVVRDRSRRIREISARLAASFLDSQVGRVHRALTLEDGRLAVTGNYVKVRIPPGHARNEWVSIRLASRQDGELLGG